jgi:hypothetical protein
MGSLQKDLVLKFLTRVDVTYTPTYYNTESIMTV